MSVFDTTNLSFRRKVFVWAGAQIDIADTTNGTLVGYVKMKAFKLKEDIRIFTDNSMTTELLTIHARQIIDFGATYDVLDPATQQPLFSLRRKGLRSTFVRDKWLIFGTDEAEIGSIVETGTFAVIRRYIAFIPYAGVLFELLFFFMKIDYKVFVRTTNGEEQAAVIVRQKNPFVIKYTTDTTSGNATVDSRIVVAGATLLSAIEVGKN